MLKTYENIQIFEVKKENVNYRKKKIYYGLSILKVILALDVINSHCFNKKSTNNKFILYLTKRRRIHVPSFVIMSFYFTHNVFTYPDFKIKYKRFERLLVPYIGWPLIIFITNNTLYYFRMRNYYIPFKLLLYQIIIAQATYMPYHFWFLFDLIITNIFFFFIMIIFKNHYLLCFQLLLIFSYFLQYSKLNVKLFFYLNAKQSIGRETELLSFAITGFILFELNIINNLQKYKFNTFIISLLIYNLIEDYQIFSDFEGIAYNGIKLNILSNCVIFIFSLLSLEKVKKKYLINFIKVFTNYTGGIFYLHQLIQWKFANIIIYIKKGTFSGLFLIYLLCYIICFLGMYFFGKTKAKYLFS